MDDGKLARPSSLYVYLNGWVSIPYVFLTVRDALGSDCEGPFDGRPKIEFHGVMLTSDTGLPAFRELDDAFRLTEAICSMASVYRRGSNIRHGMLTTLSHDIC